MIRSVKKRVRMLILLAVLLAAAFNFAWTAGTHRPSAAAASDGGPGSGISGGPGAPALYDPPNGELYLGVSTDIGRLDAFDQAAGLPAGAHPAVYDQYTTPDGPVQPTLDNARTRTGMTPMISWNLPMTGGQVTSGTEDSYIEAQAAAVKAYGGPVFIRLDWEMNATWYNGWNEPDVTPADFIAGWRHVYELFQAAGAQNAAFVWCPNLWNGPNNESAQDWYPGDQYVNWLGIDAYPQAAVPDYVENGPGGLADTAKFAEQRAKPLMVAEWAPDFPQPDTAAAMDLIFDFAQQNPDLVKAVVYFDFNTNGKDYTLADHPVGAAAFRQRVDGNPAFLLTLG